MNKNNMSQLLDQRQEERIFSIGLHHMKKSEYNEAEKYFYQLFRSNPNHNNALNLGKVSYHLAKYNRKKLEQAVQALNYAFKLNPMDLTPMRLVIDLLSSTNFHHDASLYAEKLYQMVPDDLWQALLYSKLLIATNQNRKALDVLLPFLQTHPEDLDLLFALATIDCSVLDPSHIEILKQHAKTEVGTGINRLEKIQGTNFILADFYDSRKEYQTAWRYYQEANCLGHKAVIEDLKKVKQFDLLELLEQNFTKEFHEKTKPDSSRMNMEEPIFIVGMPRSGTTLVEQIVSSHSDVFGVGETTYLRQACMDRYQDSVVILMKNFASSGVKVYKEIAEHYLSLIKTHTKGHLRFTDKMPHNFMYIGLIKTIFPKAKIIYCKRDPIATCHSIYTKNFNTKHYYSFDLKEIINHYKQHEKVMKHWHSVFGDDIYQVNYETLIEDSTNQIKQIIAYCNLDWQDQCLDFHKNKRAVATASMQQVTKKIYNNANQKWRKYEKHLDILKEAFPDFA